MGRVIAVCISKEKGTQKYRIPEGEFIEEWGIKDDAPAGNGTVRSVFFPMTRSRIPRERCRDRRWSFWRKPGSRRL